MELDTLPNNLNFETPIQLEKRINLEVADFFEVAPLKPEITTYDDKVNLDREWIDRSDGRYTEAPDWLVAFATHSGQIHILSPDIMPASFEKSSQLRFSKTLKHEIGHIYTSQINRHAPSWLCEGISLYMAGQNHYKKVSLDKITLALLDELEDTPTDGKIYQLGKNMVDLIMENFNKDTLLSLVAIKDKEVRYQRLQEMFVWLK